MNGEHEAEHQRRQRYAGTHPRRFEEKYKELDPVRHAETIERVLASGKTPAGMHVPVMVEEILAFLSPAPGQVGVDATLGYGGHSEKIMPMLVPDGKLMGMDRDPLQLPRTEKRLRGLGFGADVFIAVHSNFAGLPKVVAEHGQLDFFLADLGCSSMQIDDPARGFTYKSDGPLDMRMNPGSGLTARQWLQRVSSQDLENVLLENADEPKAAELAGILAGKDFQSTGKLASCIRAHCGITDHDAATKCIRRIFQAIRIAVNDEFGALDGLLRVLPGCLKSGARAAFLTFHSGEDRRVKKAIKLGAIENLYIPSDNEFCTPSADECRMNPRASSAKLRCFTKA